MKLFNLQDGQLTEVDRDSFKLEKDMQTVVENNLDALFGLEFVSSEFTIDKFRIDTLAFNEETNSFVIIEYKRGQSYSVVDQGYSYLSIMLNNKADFILEYNEKRTGNLKRSDIDWSLSKVVFISPSFNNYQKNSVNFRDIPFELWEIKRFSGGLTSLEQHQSSSKESIEKLSSTESSSVISEVTAQVKTLSEEDHIKKLNNEMLTVWEELKYRLEQFQETNFVTQRNYISWKRETSVIGFIHFLKDNLKIEILRGTKKATGETSKGFFTLDDPKNFSRERNWTRKSGEQGHIYVIRFSKLSDLDYVMFLLEQKFSSLS